MIVESSVAMKHSAAIHTLLTDIKHIAERATTDLGGCVTDKDVEYQYLYAIERILEIVDHELARGAENNES